MPRGTTINDRRWRKSRKKIRRPFSRDKKSQRPSSRKKTWCSRQDLRQFRPAVFLQAKPILKVEVPLWHTEGREIGNGINKACMVARC